MINLWHRAFNNEDLAPVERALLKFAHGVLYSALLTALTAIVPLVANQQLSAIHWNIVLTTLISTFVMALINAGVKWVTAHSEMVPQIDQQVVPFADFSAAVKSGASAMVPVFHSIEGANVASAPPAQTQPLPVITTSPAPAQTEQVPQEQTTNEVK